MISVVLYIKNNEYTVCQVYKRQSYVIYNFGKTSIWLMLRHIIILFQINCVNQLIIFQTTVHTAHTVAVNKGLNV